MEKVGGTASGADEPQRTDTRALEPGAQPERPDVFVSYSRAEQEFVRRLVAGLESCGKDVWVDWSDVRKGAEWRVELEAGIESARTVVAVLSPEFAESDVCREEIDHAVQHGKRLLPILRCDVDAALLRDALAARNWIFFREADDFEAALAELVAAADSDLEWLDRHARLLVRAREWERADRNPSFLLRGSDLRAAETWVAQQGSHQESATALQGDYVLASRRAATRRQRITMGAVLLALAVAVVLAVVAVIQRSTAVSNEKTARSRAFASAALAQLQSHPEVGVLLALEGVRTKTTPQATDALRRALAASYAEAVYRGRPGWVEHAQLSRDGRRVLTAGSRGKARIWDAASGRLMRTLAGTRAAFNAAGTLVATAGPDDDFSVWNARTGTRLHLLRGHTGRPRGAVFDADGRRLFTYARDGTLRVWDVRSGEQLQMLRGLGIMLGAGDVSADGRRIVTFGGDDNGGTYVEPFPVWDTVSGRKLALVNALFEPAISPDGRLVVTWGGGHYDAIVSDARTGKLVARLHDPTPDDPYGSVMDAAFSPRSSRVVTTTQFGAARIWDARTGRLLAELLGHDGTVTSAAFSPDGKLVVTASDDGTARVWDAEGGHQRELAVLRGHAGPLTSAEFAAGGSKIVTAGQDGTVRVWDMSAFVPVETVRGSVVNIAFSADGRFLVGWGFGATGVWSVDGGRRTATLPPAGEVVPARRGLLLTDAQGQGVRVRLFRVRPTRVLLTVLGFARVTPSGDGRHLLTLSSTGRVTLRRTTPGTDSVSIGARGATDVWLSANASRVLTESRSSPTAPSKLPFATLWRGSDGARLATVRERVRNAVFSPDGLRLVTWGAGQNAYDLREWDGTTGHRLAVLIGHSFLIESVRFSADGTRIVSTGLDGTARVWDAPTGRLLLTLVVGTMDVHNAAFDPTGQFLAAGSEDGTARIWDLATGEPLEQLAAGDYVEQMEFSPDGTHVATAGLSAARIFACVACGPLEQLVAVAERRVARTLTPAEQRRYVRNENATS